MLKAKQDNRWNATYGTYLSGQAAIDGADAMAIEMERQWGAGRLRLLVSTELREKFDRQRFLYQVAIQLGNLEEVRIQAARMTTAWQALDRAAETAGASRLAPEVWEVPLKDGTVAALVRDEIDAYNVSREGRRVVTYTLEEIGGVLENYREVVDSKLVFPGAEVVAIRRQSIEDPLDAIRDGVSLDDPLDDIQDFNQ